MDFVALPKIELHAHLTGSISRRALHEIWLRKKATGETSLEDPLAVMPEGKHDYNIKTFFPLFSSYIYNLLTDEQSIRFTTTSVLKDFMNDGVVYLELRTTPRGSKDMSAEAYVETLLSTIAEFESSNPRMHTRLILSVDRRHDLETASSIIDLAIRHRAPTLLASSENIASSGAGVVGIDLCGDPSARPNGEIEVFTPLIKRAQAHNLSITVHFAEAEPSSSRTELETLLSWNPDRLGHVIWEDEQVKRTIMEKGKEVCLELCLSCNVQADMVKGGFEGHHFGEWRGVKGGPRISIATDDVGVFGSPLSNEYRLVAQHFRLDRDEICAMARESIEAIFGGEAEKARLRDIMWT